MATRRGEPEELNLSPGVDCLADVDGEWVGCSVQRLRILPRTNICEFYIEFEDNPEINRWVLSNSIKVREESDKKMEVDTVPYLTRSVAKQLGMKLPTVLPQPDPEVRVIKHIQLGDLKIETVYSSRYPDNHKRAKLIHVCRFCLKYIYEESDYNVHKRICMKRTPPGVNIYRGDGFAFYEVKGSDHKLFCQNLSLLAKPFIESKGAIFDIEHFTYYTLYEETEDDRHIVGYFSKTTRFSLHNLSCLLVLPPYQRKGYGFLLVEMSYLIAHIKGIDGGPEYPLSDAGRKIYLKYWHFKVVAFLRYRRFFPVNLIDIAQKTGLLYNHMIAGLMQAQIHRFISQDFSGIIPIGSKIWYIIEHTTPKRKHTVDFQLLRSKMENRDLPTTSTSTM